ncbi:hypothetical protein [Paenibacillus sp. PAMC 26794]|uniref:TlpA family protein disulfide reductase n=1 Tax=Paenibacillus sp. PAMC 26794 TaxID=1257080 RepID=UPI000373C1F9|nr:hypothetical protein [Paenibacillus sp. PAMC 26794]
MDDEHKDKPHMRFLKNSFISQLDIGRYVPQPIEIEKRCFDDTVWSSEEYNGSVILITSFSCNVCNAEVARDLAGIFPNFQFVLFTDGTTEQVEQLRERLSGIKVVHANVFMVIRQLAVPGVPFAIAVNSEGQIVSGKAFDSIETVKLAIRPLLEVYYDEAL